MLCDLDFCVGKVSQITEQIWLGGENDANDMNFRKEQGITHILTIGDDLEVKETEEIEWMEVIVEDSEEADLAQYFDQFNNFIDIAVTSGGKILVHCLMGKSRSVSALIAYFMKKEGKEFAEVYRWLRTKRKWVSPNQNFIN